MNVAPREGRRRALHLASGLIGALALLAPTAVTSLVVYAVLAVALVLEGARHDSPSARAWLDRLALGAFRPRETRRVSGPTLLALGYAGAWLAFPGPPAAAAMLVTAFADPAAALAGSRAAPLGGGKTWVGTVAAFTIALAVLAALRTPWPAAAGVASVAALAERVPWGGLDNLLLPLATAAALRLLA